MNDHIKVKGCGCRFRGSPEECEHLCDKHKDEFILEKYNQSLMLNRMMESDAMAMDEMNKEMQQQQQESLLSKDGKSIDIGKIISKLDEIEKK
jgi:hypothetical protein